MRCSPLIVFIQASASFISECEKSVIPANAELVKADNVDAVAPNITAPINFRRDVAFVSIVTYCLFRFTYLMFLLVVVHNRPERAQLVLLSSEGVHIRTIGGRNWLFYQVGEVFFSIGFCGS